MEEYNESFDTYLRNLKIIFWALVTGQIIFAAIAINFITINNNAIAHDWEDVLGIINPVISISCILAGFTFYKGKVSKIETIENEEDRIGYHRQANIVMYAILEAPALLAIVSLILTNNLLFLIVLPVTLAAL